MTLDGDLRRRTDERIAYHGEVSAAMTAERTILESGLIPVTAYILVAAAEAYLRWPAMVEAVDAAVPFEELGSNARRPGCRVDAVHLWSLANIHLQGRKFLLSHGLAPEDATGTAAVLDAWERAATSFHGGRRQAWDAGGVLTPYGDDVVEDLLDGVETVSEMVRPTITRFAASLTNFLFLQYFDTRVGTADTGPYELSGDRTLLVRDWHLHRDDFWWAVDLDLPYRHLVAALVLDGVEVRVNDWGTAVTDPEDYLQRLVGFSLATTDAGGTLRPVGLDELETIVGAVRTGQSRLYRDIAAMSRAEKVRCGAHVYFGFLRPFAELAGVAAELDWTVPRDTVANGVYPLLEAVDGATAGAAGELTSEPYYAPLTPA